MSSKDRTGLFSSKGKFRITEDTGKIIKEWSESGVAPPVAPITVEELKGRIKREINVEGLTALYKAYPKTSQLLIPEFNKRKQEILNTNLVTRQSVGGNGNGT